MIYSLAVHTYRYLLFGETFESDEDGAFGYPPCRAFFSEVPAGHNPVERQGKDDFPT